MTGEELYQRMRARITELVAEVQPRERHKHTGKLIYWFCEQVRELATPDLAQDFEAAMKRHGY